MKSAMKHHLRQINTIWHHNNAFEKNSRCSKYYSCNNWRLSNESIACRQMHRSNRGVHNTFTSDSKTDDEPENEPQFMHIGGDCSEPRHESFQTFECARKFGRFGSKRPVHNDFISDPISDTIDKITKMDSPYRNVVKKNRKDDTKDDDGKGERKDDGKDDGKETKRSPDFSENHSFNTIVSELIDDLERSKDRKREISDQVSRLPLIDPDFKSLKPTEIVLELDKHIVGQTAAKRSVSIALRNRWRRQQLDISMRDEVSPKNILMIGSTGVGKTEIGRRLAKLSQAPFVKVEATKFTEVGFHGRDVDKIIQDLVETSIHLTRQIRMEQQRSSVEQLVEDQLLDQLMETELSESRSSSLEKLRNGDFDERLVTIDAPVASPSSPTGPSLAGGPFEIQASQIPIHHIFANMVNVSKGILSKSKEKFKMSVVEARKVLTETELESRLESSDITKDAIQLAEQHGIVFIDEIDKICSNGESRSSADASAEGVQRDLLPLIEGSVVQTKHGNINTDHILFITSGAFHTASPSDLLPELQGRLPIRVELEALTERDLYRILTEPKANLINQQKMLMNTEGLELEFDEDAILEMARIAALVNRTVENIGARRLHTIIERTMEEISFFVGEMVDSFNKGSPLPAGVDPAYSLVKVDGSDRPRLTVTKEMMTEKLGNFSKNLDYKRFIL